MQKITPCLWFESDGEDALDFYTSVIKDAQVTSRNYWGEAGPGEAGTLLTATFDLFGQTFMIINGGAMFDFNQAVSLMITCEDQAEVDYYWQAFSVDGKELQCGWIQDKYGLPWQIVPKQLGEMMSDPDPDKVQRVTAAMMPMVKLDIAGLEKAFNG